MPRTTLGFTIASILCFSMMLIYPCFFLKPNLQYYFPFLVMCLYRYSLTKCLWIAFAVGFLADCLFSCERLGWIILSYLLTVPFMYKIKNFFFKDSAWTLSIMTYFYSSIATLIQLFCHLLFDSSKPLPFVQFITEIFVNPIFDASFALIGITLPLFIFRFIRKQRRRV